jgi:hypothetical protein
MSMAVKLDLHTPVVCQYDGSVTVKDKEYLFEARWNADTKEVDTIDWVMGNLPPKGHIMKAEQRIVQLVSQIVNGDMMTYYGRKI